MNYKIYNFIVQSELELPDFKRIKSGKPDVYIRFGTVPTDLLDSVTPGIFFNLAPEDFILKIDNIASYRVQEGKYITIEACKNASKDEIVLFLLGSTFGALLHQRGLLPLHGSAVSLNSEPIIIIGDSSAGKSSLAASLGQKDFQVISDDISVIVPNVKGELSLVPGMPYLKLWGDVIDILFPNNTYKKVRSQIQKYKVPIAEGDFSSNNLIVKKIVMLSTTNNSEFNLELITGIQKVNILTQNIYRSQFVQQENYISNCFNTISKLANQVVMFKIERPLQPMSLPHLTEFFIEKIVCSDQL